MGGSIQTRVLGVESERGLLFVRGLAVAAVMRGYIRGFAVGGAVGGEVSEKRREGGDAGYEDLWESRMLVGRFRSYME